MSHTPSLARAWLCSFAAAASVAAGSGQQPIPGPVPGAGSGSGTPARDPVTVRGCVDKKWLRVLEHDITDLSGVSRVRIKASRAMLALLNEARGHHVEITGDLDLGRRDRIETRRKHKVGSKTTISLGASAEQVRGPDVTAPEPTLVVDAFTVLGDSCPSR